MYSNRFNECEITNVGVSKIANILEGQNKSIKEIQ